MRNLSCGLASLLLIPSALLATVGTPVPEPASMVLIGGGLAALILLERKRRSRK